MTILTGIFLSPLALLALAGPAGAVEIATGKMLGAGHDARSFYVRDGGGAWRKTYTGKQYRPEAAGRLMNLRVAQGLFHDEWMTEVPFDPDKHTSRLIAALDTYKEHGVLAISVSLQGGNPAYELFDAIKRDRPHKLGPGKGALVSAFRPDGSLKDAWMARLLRLVRELDRRGMILNLMYFYQHQDEVLENPAAIERGARNVTDWLIDNNCRNVIDRDRQRTRRHQLRSRPLHPPRDGAADRTRARPFPRKEGRVRAAGFGFHGRARCGFTKGCATMGIWLPSTATTARRRRSASGSPS